MKAKTAKDVNLKEINSLLQKGKRSPFPSNIQPMLATLVDKPFDEKGWVYEVKWDGYRTLAFLNKGKVDIRSRNNKSFNEKFYPVYNALLEWKINAVVDGEIIVITEKGLSSFGDLQTWFFFDIVFMLG